MQNLKKEFSIVFKENKSGGGQKGISLLFVILIMSVILSISLGISTILLQQFRMTGEISDSIVAFYIADSGIEVALYDFYIGPEVYPDPHSEYYYYKDSLDLDNLYQYEVNVWCDKDPDKECPLGDETHDYRNANCETKNFCINSIGTYDGTYEETKRAIEIKY